MRTAEWSGIDPLAEAGPTVDSSNGFRSLDMSVSRSSYGPRDVTLEDMSVGTGCGSACETAG